MDAALFDELQTLAKTRGAPAAFERLCDDLRRRKDYANLFNSLLLKKRHELGLPLLANGPSQDLPEEYQAPYEDAIRAAGREVGQLFLAEGNIASAWLYFRMLGEPGPVVEAIDRYIPGADEDAHGVIDIAFNQGAHPRKGFDMLLERNGLCSAITVLGGVVHHPESRMPADVRNYCIQRLLHALYDELRARLRAEIERREGTEPPAATSVSDLLKGRDWLFEDDYFHVDVSHLSAVVQMAVHLDACPELGLAREMCAYGERLAPQFHYMSDPPFENQYRDYGIFLGILDGSDVEGGLAHFHAKAENADPETIGTYPAQVLVNLLLRLGRTTEALDAARKFLAKEDERQLTCPGVAELCRRTGNYAMLSEVAREQGDPIHFLVGLVENKQER
jgi:hypothetical protein